MPSVVEIEEGLVHGIQNGDSSALSRIMDRYSAYVSTIIWNILQGKLSKADAEEVVSDVFYTLWTNADKVQPRKLKGYLSVIARRRALNALRGRKNANVPLEDDVVQLPIPGPEDESIRREEYAALRQTVDALPEPDRTIFIRHYFYYQKTSEIAKAMKINAAIDQAVAESVAQGIKGKRVTPFLLARVKELTGGDSLASNIRLVLNNAALAAKTAAALCEIKN